MLRNITLEDLPLIDHLIEADPFHRNCGETSAFFTQPNGISQVVCDEDGPILFCKATKSLRLEIQFVSNTSTRANIRAMREILQDLETKAASSGFTEIIFATTHNKLRDFSKRAFGFEEVSGTELRKLL